MLYVCSLAFPSIPRLARQHSSAQHSPAQQQLSISFFHSIPSHPITSHSTPSHSNHSLPIHLDFSTRSMESQKSAWPCFRSAPLLLLSLSLSLRPKGGGETVAVAQETKSDGGGDLPLRPLQSVSLSFSLLSSLQGWTRKGREGKGRKGKERKRAWSTALPPYLGY